MASGPYDIVLLAPPDIAAKAIRTSRELEALDTLFTLDEETNLPHSSIYMVQLKESDLAEVQARLADIAAATRSISLEADCYMQSGGYLDANYARTPAIDALLDKVVTAINPLRDGMRPQAKHHLAYVGEQEKKYIEQYGDHRVAEFFRPHLTLTRFKNSNPIPVEDLLDPRIFNATFTELALCEMGSNGTCKHKVASWRLA